MDKIYTSDSKDSLEQMLCIEWNNDEYYDDALERAVCVAALKLSFWRKHPKLYKMRITQVISGAWFEITAFIAYERLKFYAEFQKGVFRKFGRNKTFMEIDYDRMKSLGFTI